MKKNSIIGMIVIIVVVLLTCTGSIVYGAVNRGQGTESFYVPDIAATNLQAKTPGITAEAAALVTGKTAAPPAGIQESPVESEPEKTAAVKKDNSQIQREIQEFLSLQGGNLSSFNRQTVKEEDVLLYSLPFLDEFKYQGMVGYGADISKVIKFAKNYFGREITRETLENSSYVYEISGDYIQLVGTCYTGYKWEVEKITDLGDGMYSADCKVTVFDQGQEYVEQGTAMIMENPDSQYGYMLVTSQVG